MSIMKIGGRTVADTVKGVLVDEDGSVKTVKKWDGSIINLFEAVIDTTGTYSSERFDVSTSGAISLRVLNPTDADITIGLYSDIGTGNYWMYDAAGKVLSVTVASRSAAPNTPVIITPDDLPALLWLRSIKIRVSANVAPTNGKAVKIYLVTKG